MGIYDNFQLPTPKSQGESLAEWGERRTRQRVVATSPPLFEQLSLGVGSW